MLVVNRIDTTDHGNGGVVHLEAYRSVNFPLLTLVFIVLGVAAGVANAPLTALTLFTLAMISIGISNAGFRWGNIHAVVSKSAATGLVEQFNGGDRDHALQVIRSHQVGVA